MLPNPWRTTTFSTTVLASFFANSLCMARSYLHTICMFTAPPVFFLSAHWTVFFHSAVFLSLQSMCLMHTGKPEGVAVSQCIKWFRTQLILTTCQICYHSHLWDHNSTGQL